VLTFSDVDCSDFGARDGNARGPFDELLLVVPRKSMLGACLTDFFCPFLRVAALREVLVFPDFGCVGFFLVTLLLLGFDLFLSWTLALFFVDEEGETEIEVPRGDTPPLPVVALSLP